MNRAYVGVGVLAAVITTLGAQPARAQQQTSNTDAAATNTVNVLAITGPQTQVPQRQEVEYSGHTWTTPSVAGSYFGGTNPCLVGTGGGAAGGPIAFSLNLGRNDQGCQRRSEAAAWHAMGFDNVAVARLCQDRDSADAFFAATGQACPGQRGERYRTPSGDIAPEAPLVAQARAIPNNPYAATPAAMLQTPEGQRLVQQAALQMLKNNPSIIKQFQQQRPATFEEGEEAERPVEVPIPGGGTGAPK